MKHFGIILASSALVLAVAAPAATAAAPDATAAALARVSQGTQTDADVKLIKSQPKLAATVPDPDNVVIEVTTGNIDGGGQLAVEDATALLATICGEWVKTHVKQYSFLGSLIYDWDHYLQYCRNGSIVTKFEQRYDFLHQTSGVVEFGGLTVNAASGVGSYQAYSHRQRHLTYCIVKYGCYNNSYPWSKIWVNAKGGASWTLGK